MNRECEDRTLAPLSRTRLALFQPYAEKLTLSPLIRRNRRSEISLVTVSFMHFETEREGVAGRKPRGRKEALRGLPSFQPPFPLCRSTVHLELQSRSAGAHAAARSSESASRHFVSGCSLRTTCFATAASSPGLAHRSILSQAELVRFQLVLRRDFSPMRPPSSRRVNLRPVRGCCGSIRLLSGRSRETLRYI